MVWEPYPIGCFLAANKRTCLHNHDFLKYLWQGAKNKKNSNEAKSVWPFPINIKKCLYLVLGNQISFLYEISSAPAKAESWENCKRYKASHLEFFTNNSLMSHENCWTIFQDGKLIVTIKLFSCVLSITLVRWLL